MTIDDILTEKQINAILDIIRRECKICADNLQQEINETYQPYMKGRKQYDITGQVLSGFKIYEDELPDIVVTDIEYGSGRVQPELKNERVILHIYFESNPLNNEIITERCKEYNSNLHEWPIYACIKYNVNKKCILTSVQIVFLDVNAKVISKEIIYQVEEVIMEKSA